MSFEMLWHLQRRRKVGPIEIAKKQEKGRTNKDLNVTIDGTLCGVKENIAFVRNE